MTNKLFGVLAVLGLGLAGQAGAQEAAPEGEGPARVIRAEDVSLTCIQMADEAAALSASMGGEPSDSLFGRLGGVARSGAALLLPGAGLVMAGADALTKPGEERREAEAEAEQNRWYYLNGLYAGRRCQERAEASVTEATSATVPAATPAIATGALDPVR